MPKVLENVITRAVPDPRTHAVTFTWASDDHGLIPRIANTTQCGSRLGSAKTDAAIEPASTSLFVLVEAVGSRLCQRRRDTPLAC